MMNMDFHMEDMPLPENGLADVRRRARRIALRQRAKRMAQTISATVVACTLMLATGLFGTPATQFAQTEMQADAPAMESGRAGGGTASEPATADQSGDATSSGNEFANSQRPRQPFLLALLAFGSIALFIAGLFRTLRGIDSAQPKARTDRLGLLLLASSTTILIFGAATFLS